MVFSGLILFFNLFMWSNVLMSKLPVEGIKMYHGNWLSTRCGSCRTPTDTLIEQLVCQCRSVKAGTQSGWRHDVGSSRTAMRR